MLIIRDEQMEALGDSQFGEFEKRMARHLRSAFSMQTEHLSGPELSALIRAGIERAAEYDVTIEGDVIRYLECMFLLGQDFDTNPATAWAADILRAEDLDGSEKMDRFDERI